MKNRADQSDRNLDFNGEKQNGDSTYKYNTKYQHNHSGETMKSNYGRGPTKAGTTGKHAGPSTATGTEQKRNPSGTRERPTAMKANYGRGPTKGNAC